MIFQALGAKYTFSSAVRHAFAHGTAKDSEQLKELLGERYSGEVVLYHKGRAALSEAIRLATGGEGLVAISALTCYSVVQAVKSAGCTPVYVDINEDSLHFGAEELAESFEKHEDIAAVVVQNMLGIPVDIAAIQEVISRSKGTILIEDLAHSAGATYIDGREVGTVGDITMLSFGRDKAIDTVNGGALVIRGNFEQSVEYPEAQVEWFSQLRDRLYPAIAWKTRLLYPLGLGRYVMALAIKLKLVIRSADGEVDITEKLPHWQARLAYYQLVHLTTTTAERRAKARAFTELLNCPVPAYVAYEGAAPVRVPLLVKNRDAIVAHLKQCGIQANDIWYDVPVSPARLYHLANYPEEDNPVAVRVAASLINLPTHERITMKEIARISEVVNEAL